MAKWRLTASHYLSVPGIEWEYRETDRGTGKQNRMVLPVPLLLDPKDPTVCNRDGDCIVTRGEPGRGEFQFFGDPTPDMEPLDDEARAISAEQEPLWQHPIDSLPSNGDYSASLIASFEKQMTSLIRQGKAEPIQPVSANAVKPEEFKALQEQVAALMARNAELEQAREPKAARRA